jgi:nucleotide-binding universal stress UspA family protein
VTAARVDRVVVGISGSLGNMAALHAAVAQARRSDAELVAVLAWSPVGGEIAYRRAPCPPLLDQWRQQARNTLASAFADAWGGPPQSLVLTSVLVRGAAGPTLVRIADQPTDLIVIGAGRHGRLARLRHGSVSRYCLAHAHCPVLAVPQPDMISYLRAGRSPWRKHRGAPPAETAHRHGLSGRLT